MPRAPRNRVKMAKAKRQRRRLNRRKKPVNKPTVNFGLGLPKKAVVTHKYNEFALITSTAGIPNGNSWSCNSMFDPNAAVGGHQPLYFDQFMALYDHYTVIGSKIHVRVTPQAANEDSFRVGIYLNDDTTNLTNMSTVAEQSSGDIRLVPANSNNVYTFTKYWSAKKTFGGAVLANDNLQGDVLNSPQEQTFYTILLGATSALDVTAVVEVSIEYIAVWDELKDVAAS